MLVIILTLLALLGMPLQPCATEDSDQCYWDASERGNGDGSDFIALANGDDTIIIRLP